MMDPHGDAIGRLLGRLHACPLPPPTESNTGESGGFDTAVVAALAADVADVPALPGGRKARRSRSVSREQVGLQGRAGEGALWQEMEAWAAELPVIWTAEHADVESVPSRQVLSEELRWLCKEDGVVAPSPVVLIHKDVHGANLLQLPASSGGGLRLIDAEFADVGPRAFDVANFFLECAFVEEDGSWDWERVPTREAQLSFARAYALAFSADLTTAEADVEADALVSEWSRGWGLVAHLWNILWALATAVAAEGGGGAADGAGEDFDFLSYAAGRWERYLHEKEQMLHLWM